MRFPISIKIILMTTFIVTLSMSILTQQSSDYFKGVMLQREEFSNFTEAQLRSQQIDLVLSNNHEKYKNLAQILLKENPEQRALYKLPEDKELIGLQIWTVKQGIPYLILNKNHDQNFIKLKLPQTYLTDLDHLFKFSHAKVILKQNTLQIFSNEHIGQDSLKTVVMGIPLSIDQDQNINSYAVVAFNALSIDTLFLVKNERRFYLTDLNGSLLLGQSESSIFQTKDKSSFSKQKIIQKIVNDPVAIKQFSYKDPSSQDSSFVAYVKNLKWQTFFIAETPEKIILEPASAVQRKAILIAGIVMSVALFVVFLFSLTISKPIENLAELIKQIPKGKFDISAKNLIKSNDEVGDLAKAFDHMTEGLKERDKVKNLFNKFHGSSITEHLLSQEIAVGGHRKEITVFFSDIRGFTEFSEGHSPEEVVEMLNEYFAVMVKIINQHGGVVDKFIGDAIMAVWGVPVVHEDDTAKALKACLAMRNGLLELNKNRKSRGLSEIQIGMGLHAGSAISGNIGSEERMEITVIGDTVNVTSRIESSTKVLNTDLLVSEEIYTRLSSQQDRNLQFELAGDIKVKGKKAPLTLYRVNGA